MVLGTWFCTVSFKYCQVGLTKLKLFLKSEDWWHKVKYNAAQVKERLNIKTRNQSFRSGFLKIWQSKDQKHFIQCIFLFYTFLIYLKTFVLYLWRLSFCPVSLGALRLPFTWLYSLPPEKMYQTFLTQHFFSYSSLFWNGLFFLSVHIRMWLKPFQDPSLYWVLTFDTAPVVMSVSFISHHCTVSFCLLAFFVT